jgi:hypothetical protein
MHTLDGDSEICYTVDARLLWLLKKHPREEKMPTLPIPDWSPREFFELAETYSERVAQEVPGFLATVAKWRSEDLIPGLSDIDTRIVCRDMSPEEWMVFDQTVSDVHLSLVRERPEWSRKLEHEPGCCLTPGEAFDERLYHAEMAHWTFYCGDHDFIFRLREYMRGRTWEVRDQLHHLKRWLMFWGPYNREIDPPINIAPSMEPKYALHSRAMHYFVPSLQAGLSLMTRRSVHGKREALFRWLERLPNEPVLDETAHMLDVHYNVPALHDRDELYAYEARCYSFLRQIAPQVLASQSAVELPGNADLDESMAALRAGMASLKASPLTAVYDGLWGSRARRARYWLYLDAPEHFATEWLVRNEVGFLQRNFTAYTWRAYATLKWDEPDLSLSELLSRAQPDPLSADEAALVTDMFAIAERSKEPGLARSALRAAAERYGDYYAVLDKIYRDARARS